jgi:hypothetical protein
MPIKFVLYRSRKNFQRATFQALATPRSIINPWVAASLVGRAGLYQVKSPLSSTIRSKVDLNDTP